MRIPIGYWIMGQLLPGEPFVLGGWAYLVRALTWIKAAGMQALIDLHGAPGSQNGHDNSGVTGPINWPTEYNVNRTIAYMAYLGANLTVLNTQPATQNVVFGIEVRACSCTATASNRIALKKYSV